MIYIYRHISSTILLSIKMLKANKWNYLSLYIFYWTLLIPIQKKLKSKEIQPVNKKNSYFF
jgi:hypothetical protein